MQLQFEPSEKKPGQRERADSLFSQRDWQGALLGYKAIPGHQINSVLLLRISECCFNLGQYEEAYLSAMRASEFHKSLHRAVQIQARSARMLGKTGEWISLTETAFTHSQPGPELTLDYAEALLLGVGDTQRARTLAEGLTGNTQYRERASWLVLLSLIYDRPDHLDARQVAARFHQFAAQYISPFAEALLFVNGAPQVNESAVKRVGFVGPVFHASSTMFMGIKVFRKLAELGCELVFFSRSPKKDWLTTELENLPGQVIDCSSMSVAQMNELFASSRLSELYDMSGWLDVDVLKALTAKPAGKIFKWLGGQLCSTGLGFFDGFVSDVNLTPPSTHGLYTEPLISFGSPGQMFTKCPDFPKPRKRVGMGSITRLRRSKAASIGVCAPPTYMSQAFLKMLDQLMQSMPEGVRLLLIDPAYSSITCRTRIRKLLALPEVRIEFLAPGDYLETLSMMNELDLLVDTFPHSSGIRLLEAKNLQLPVHLFPFDRQLFCERQAISYSLG